MRRAAYLIIILGILSFLSVYGRDIARMLEEYRTATLQPTQVHYIQDNTSRLLTITPAQRLSPTLSVQKAKTSSPEEQWGVAKEIGEGTYTIRVGNDAAMGSPSEILDALNAYRNVSGRGSLTWDDNLGNYAQSRAEYQKSIDSTDKHAGFNNFLENEDGFTKLGFYRLGENSYYGGPLNGVHLIEWVFAKSPGHDANQKSSDWSHVGIGVTDRTVNLVFGGSKM